MLTARKSIAQVASVSAADEEIRQMIAEAMEKVGKDGVITVEESKSMGTTLEVVEGMQFDRGYLSAYMVTDTEKMEAASAPYILITDKKISISRKYCLFWNRSYSRAESCSSSADDAGRRSTGYDRT